MNLPNKLTLLRFILAPVACLFILCTQIPHSWLISGIIFGIASITDALDGKIARKRGLITDFGKLMDPMADKLLVIGAFVCFCALGLCSPWVIIIMLAREFIVTSVRLVSAEKGIVIAANNWGKAKTVTQIVAIVTVMVVQYALYLLGLFNVPTEGAISLAANIVMQTCNWIAAIITLISGIIYIWQSRELFADAG